MYIPAFSIEDVLLDRDSGAPLSGGLVYFEKDNQRGILKPVYQITGASPDYTFIQMPNPVTLSSIGTFEDSLGNPVIPYFYPYDVDGDVELYYVRVTSSEDVLQFDREAQPYIATQGSDDILSVITNEIANPQFAEVLFDTSAGAYTYNVDTVTDSVISIAPDWDLIVSASGVGSITLTQVKPAGSLNVITNPGTVLTITSSGLSKLQLRQRKIGIPNLWGSGYISASFVARVLGGSSATLNMYYSQSDGLVVDQELISALLPSSGAYDMYSGSKLIDESNSTETFPDAYVDIFFDIPLSVTVDITSVMLAFTGDASINNISYDQESLERQVDHLFHYFKPQLDFKPVSSLLTGWDFPLNPAQLRGSTVTMQASITPPTAEDCYIWDQTICNSLIGNVDVVRNAVTQGFQATTTNANEAFYMIQYITGAQAKKLLGTTLSVNMFAYKTAISGAVTAKVYLYSARFAAVIPALPTMIGTVAANGDFTLTAANWRLIPRGALGTASSLLPSVDVSDFSTLNDIDDLSFSGWEMTTDDHISNTDKCAIVITFSCPTTASRVIVNSISLTPGDIPTRPAPQTPDEVLRECERYYEKSYESDVIPGTASTSSGVLNFLQPSSGSSSIAAISYAGAFDVRFRVAKVVTPEVNIYSPVSGTLNAVYAQILYHPAIGPDGEVHNNSYSIGSQWTQNGISTKGFSYIPIVGALEVVNSAVLAEQSTAYIRLHYVADARIGLV